MPEIWLGNFEQRVDQSGLHQLSLAGEISSWGVRWADRANI
jgi:hypothetical protein